MEISTKYNPNDIVVFNRPNPKSTASKIEKERGTEDVGYINSISFNGNGNIVYYLSSYPGGIKEEDILYTVGPHATASA